MRRRRWQAVLGLCAAGAALGLSIGERPARAQNASDKAAAEAIFDEAKRLYADKKYAEACARFDASEKLDRGVGTLLYLADCYEHVGRVASAWATFREAESLAKEASQSEREHIAAERAVRLEPRLYRLTVTVAARPPGLKVMRGDVEVRSETFGAGLPVDPGTYVITATAPGKKPWTIQVQIPPAAGAQTLAIPALEDDLAAAEAARNASIPPIAGPPLPPREVPEVPGQKQRIAGIVVGSVGLVALGIAAGLTGVAASDNRTAKTDCPKAPCSNKAGVDLAGTAGTFADGATGLVVAGGVLAAGGVALFLTAPRPTGNTASAWIAPVVSPSAGGLVLGGGFQ